MSLKGSAENNNVLIGKINRLEELRGYSAYEIALINGFEGTEEEWLESLVPDGGNHAARHAKGGGDELTPAMIGAAPAVESTTYPGCYYRTVNGVTEWINPPMTEGVAYRTTERYLGKAVYTMLIDCGNLPNATSKNVSTGVSIATHTFIDLKVFAEWTSGTTAMKSAFPIINTADGIVARAQFSSSSIQIVTTTDRSTTTAYAVIKYVEK